MRRFILACLLLGFLLTGCNTIPEKDRILAEGTFLEKVGYIEENDSGKREVVEFIGRPDRKQDFFGSTAIWHYDRTEYPLEITFGSEGRIMYISIKESDEY